MSFFRGGGNNFDDPFFGDMHRMMHQQMRELDSMTMNMMDPFGMMTGRFNNGRQGQPGNNAPRQQMIDDRSGSNPRMNQYGGGGGAMIQRDPMSSFMDPFGGAFGFGGGLGGGGLFGGMMGQMQQMQAQAFANPGSHVYTQSTMISMAPGHDGRPQVVQRTESVRKHGDVKETRRSVRDSVRGVEKMEIGHHIGNRGHIIEKRRDRTTGGQILEQQEFVGELKPDDAEHFDQEWTRATRRGANGSSYLGERSHAGPQLAIEDDRSHRRERASPYSSPKKHRQHASTSDQRRKSKSTGVEQPRVEEPQEDEEPKKTNAAAKSDSNGPKIVELE